MNKRFGNYAYLPPLTDEQISKQVENMLLQGHLVMVEYADNPNESDQYWELWPTQMEQEKADTQLIMAQIKACRTECEGYYIKVSGYDKSRQLCVNSFIIATDADYS